MPDVNKVDYGGRTLIDLTEDTVTPAGLRAGLTAHDRSGASIVGTMMEHFAGYGEATKVSEGNGYEVTIAGITEITAGMVIAVRFPESIAAYADAILNVNGLGARRLAYEGYVLGLCTLNLGTQKILNMHNQGYIPKNSVVMLVAGQALTNTSGTAVDAWTITNPQPSGLYGTCSTAADTVAKQATVPGVFEQYEGLTIRVKFSYGNTASQPTLSVNGLPAVKILRNNSYAGNSNQYSWYSLAVVTLTYIVNGGVSYWSMNDWNNSVYSNAGMGHVYGECSTVDATTGECTVVAANYQLGTGAVAVIAFSVDVPVAATLNINSKGAKTLMYSGAAITAGIIKSGDLATVIYNGTSYVLMAIDHWAVKSNAGRGFANVEFSSINGDDGSLNFSGPDDYEIVDGGLVLANFTSIAAPAGCKISVNNGPIKPILRGGYAIWDDDIEAETVLLEYSAASDAYILIARSSALRAVKSRNSIQMYGVTVTTSGEKRIIKLMPYYKFNTGDAIVVFNITSEVAEGSALYVTANGASYTYTLKKEDGSGRFTTVTALSVGIHMMVCSGNVFYLVS